MRVGGHVGWTIPYALEGYILIKDSATGSTILQLEVFIIIADTSTGSTVATIYLSPITDEANGISSLWVGETIFEFLGDLEADEILKIDSNKLIVELDGSNARPNFDGDYPFLNKGDNTFVYEDEETGRTVELEIIKEDRHI